MEPHFYFEKHPTKVFFNELINPSIWELCIGSFAPCKMKYKRPDTVEI